MFRSGSLDAKYSRDTLFNFILCNINKKKYYN